jgi:hypothetical protein
MFGRVLKETKTPCLAWALMLRHIHLFLKTGQTPLATLMRRLLTGYAAPSIGSTVGMVEAMKLQK